ncbi:hypothetical protein Hanom_Chr17g01543841 [Helianthus anomalus]
MVAPATVNPTDNEYIFLRLHLRSLRPLAIQRRPVFPPSNFNLEHKRFPFSTHFDGKNPLLKDNLFLVFFFL